VLKRRFGSLDVDVPVVGLGTWQMEVDGREPSIAAIRRAIDLGMTHIDTAEIYGHGEVEDIVGEAIAGYRGEVFLASKVHPDHATYAGTLLACDKTLKRLRTDRLDLYMLHWRGKQPLEPSFEAFEALREEGKIRAWGVSNFDVPDLERAIEIAGEGAIACNQVLYNLLERDAEHVLQLFCERHGIALVAYTPLAAAQFPKPGSWRGDVLAGIAAAHRATPRTIALAFLLRRPGTFVIPKTGNAAHVDELARAADVVLGHEEIATIDDAFPLGAPKSKLPYA
jgi:diketogulonate reductase-like aldo/keto reductase